MRNTESLSGPRRLKNICINRISGKTKMSKTLQGSVYYKKLAQRDPNWGNGEFLFPWEGVAAPPDSCSLFT